MVNFLIKSVMKSNNITEDQIDKAIEDRKDVISEIINQAESDSCNESNNLLKFYRDCNARDRAVIDITLSYICGWYMPSIINMAGNEEEY